jgi:hypothetical protein
LHAYRCAHGRLLSTKFLNNLLFCGGIPDSKKNVTVLLNNFKVKFGRPLARFGSVLRMIVVNHGGIDRRGGV